jgi:uncharacterized Ntn-hydrolase superfamily protein
MSETVDTEGETFTIIGRCERTGMLGVCLATSEIATGSRGPHVKARVGAVSTQARTNPRLGTLAINLLELGFSAPKVVEEVRSSDLYIEHRQIGVVDRDGNSAVYTGKDNSDWKGSIAKKNFIAMGNYLANEKVVEEMAGAFKSSVDECLEERLMRAIEAGRDAGGQKNGQQNAAALIVYDWDIVPRVDLRVDWNDDDAIAELRRLLEMYKPLIPFYSLRLKDPTIGGWRDWLANKKTS